MFNNINNTFNNRNFKGACIRKNYLSFENYAKDKIIMKENNPINFKLIIDFNDLQFFFSKYFENNNEFYFKKEFLKNDELKVLINSIPYNNSNSPLFIVNKCFEKDNEYLIFWIYYDLVFLKYSLEINIRSKNYYLDFKKLENAILNIDQFSFKFIGLYNFDELPENEDEIFNNLVIYNNFFEKFRCSRNLLRKIKSCYKNKAYLYYKWKEDNEIFNIFHFIEENVIVNRFFKIKIFDEDMLVEPRSINNYLNLNPIGEGKIKLNSEGNIYNDCFSFNYSKD